MNSIETIQILNYLFSLSAGSEGYRPSAAGWLYAKVLNNGSRSFERNHESVPYVQHSCEQKNEGQLLPIDPKVRSRHGRTQYLEGLQAIEDWLPSLQHHLDSKVQHYVLLPSCFVPQV
jgi:hypothetical protein